MNRVPPTFDDEGRQVEVPESTDDYIEPDTKCSIETTVDLIKYIRELPSHFPNVDANFPFSEPLVKPILTPRFALSCTEDLLTGLGALAYNDKSLNIQTHISENPKEVADTRKAFPQARNYADVYNIFGLLRHNTILGHGVHLEDDELRLIKEKEAGISHCPVSNFNLRSGIAQIGKYLDLEIKVRANASAELEGADWTGRTGDGRLGRVLPVHADRDPTRQSGVQSAGVPINPARQWRGTRAKAGSETRNKRRIRQSPVIR